MTSGCRHVARSGSSVVKFIAPPDPIATNEVVGASIPSLAPAIQYRDATPIGELANPVFPPAALKAFAGWAAVGLRIIVDESGSVSSIEPSILTLSTPGPFAAEFRRAAEDAIKQWKFKPAETRYLEQASARDGTTWMRVVRTERMERVFDVSFTFNESGRVTSR
ncbi:hypothetical protein [Oleiharenicola lentus]|uniref:hypothetical protein n=1 Tax=Oleiharenicola lentus TaxID=2508720 RepID=UPI003F67AD73